MTHIDDSHTSAVAERSPAVSLQHITKSFSNGTVALRDMSLTVGSGEFMSLLGPSGCGKSTVLRIIAGLGAPTAGRVEWPEDDKRATGEVDHDIAFVFQEPTLMPWQTVFGNVYLPMRLKGTSRIAASDRIMSALESVGLA
ncbi:MAG: ATP-binding cassette domain-containing protein, partial [Pseudomonadota bacterium]